ncbi:hypothetical protein BH10PAT4_BH10PAT4_3370 [soil metagenome]
MLILGSQLIGTSVLGLQTGAKLANITTPVVDPANLKVIAYVLEGPLLSEQPSLLLTDDIRELSSIGMIVDSNDEFIGLNDVIKVEELFELGFSVIGMTVIDETNHKLGKVDDYSVDTQSFVIQQLNVKRGIIKGLTETELLIHQSQIVEINDKQIIVHTTAKKLEPVMESVRRTYTNPFRPSSAQPENSDA